MENYADQAISVSIALKSDDYCKPSTNTIVSSIILFRMKDAKRDLELFEDDVIVDRMSAEEFIEVFRRMIDDFYFSLYVNVKLSSWLAEMVHDPRVKLDVSLVDNEGKKLQNTIQKVKDLQSCINKIDEKIMKIFKIFKNWWKLHNPQCSSSDDDSVEEEFDYENFQQSTDMPTTTKELSLSGYMKQFFKITETDEMGGVIDRVLSKMDDLTDGVFIRPQKYPNTPDDIKKYLIYLKPYVDPLFDYDDDKTVAEDYMKVLKGILADGKLSMRIDELGKWLKEIIKQGQIAFRIGNHNQEEVATDNTYDVKFILRECKDLQKLLVEVTAYYGLISEKISSQSTSSNSEL